MENITIENMYDLKETIAADLFTEAEYPWEVLPRIHDFILELGKRLPEEIYEKRGEDIWVAKNAKVAPTACLNGPLIIDEEAQWLAIPRNLRTWFCSIKYRCLIIIMWETVCWASSPIWGPVPLLPT